MALLSRRSSTWMPRTISIALAAVFVVALAPPGGAQKDKESPRSCPSLDGKYENGAWSGDAAPGIEVTAFSDEQVVFDVADGYTLTELCVKTGRELNVYNIDSTLPVIGLQTVSITKAGAGYGIGHISFDTEETQIPEVTCPTVEAPDVSFDEPLYIDRNRAGGEPVSVVAQDGSISVSAHAGTTHVYKDPSAAPGVADFAVGYFNQTLNWRSTDGGETWDYIGLLGLDQGPHSATSTGFSDPDFAMDQAGNIYNVEIDLANVSVFKSNDDGQSYLTANPESWFGDRPWVTALEEDEVFLYINLPRTLLKSIDGGLTWAPVLNYNGTSTTPAAQPPIGSKAYVDPLNPDNGLIGPSAASTTPNRPAVRTFHIGVENDSIPNEVRWQQRSVGPLGISTQFFAGMAVDAAGNVYMAGAGGYGGSTDTNPNNGEVTFGYHERETGAVNPATITIPRPTGDALWPWVIAGDDGRVALVWYQNLAGKPDEFYTFIAVSHNAHGTTVNCSDGSTEFIPPRFTVINASERPVFVGNICLNGTNCNASTNFRAGDRRLGDFFTVNFDHEGRLFIVSGDTMILNPLGGQKPVGNPIFIKQAEGGDLMLEEPRELRDTRCLMNLPVC